MSATYPHFLHGTASPSLAAVFSCQAAASFVTTIDLVWEIGFIEDPKAKYLEGNVKLLSLALTAFHLNAKLWKSEEKFVSMVVKALGRER